MDDDRDMVKLLEKIHYAKNVYDQASDSMHSSIMKSELRKIRESRTAMARDIAEHTDSGSVKNGQPPLYEKFWVMLNDLLIQKNTPYILKSCVKADQAVIDSFEELLKADGQELNKSTLGMLERHYNTVREQMHHFEKEIEQYPWS